MPLRRANPSMNQRAADAMLAQCVFRTFSFACLGGERINGLVQAQLLAPVGLAQGDEHGAHQEATNNGMNFRGLVNEREL
jgi:hypothetical protein